MNIEIYPKISTPGISKWDERGDLVLPNNHIYSDGPFIQLVVPRKPDVILRTERLLSAEEFLRDNQSEESKIKSSLWYANFGSGNMYIEISCSDARPDQDPEITLEERSVAIGFPHKPEFKNKYNDPKICAIISKAHFNGVISPGERPSGCGGQDTSAKIANGEIQVSEKGITRFVEANVDQDPMIQAVFQAREIVVNLESKNEGIKHVFIVIENHVSGEKMPIGEYIVNFRMDDQGNLRKYVTRTIPDEISEILTTTNKEDRQLKYNPSVIYAHGIPTIPEDLLSSEFRDYLNHYKSRQEQLHEDDEDYDKKHEIQDPDYLVASTIKTPIQNRYSKLFGKSACAFKVDLPRNRSRKLSDEVIESGIEQLEYGVTNSIKNYKVEGAPFANTNTLFIETGDFDESLRLAQKLCQTEWMKVWLNQKGHQIFISETRGSVTRKIMEYIPAPEINKEIELKLPPRR